MTTPSTFSKLLETIDSQRLSNLKDLQPATPQAISNYIMDYIGLE